MKRITLIIIMLASLTSLKAQDKYYTKSGKVDIYSKAELEDIQAKNNTVSVLLDSKSGAVQFSLLLKSFEFEKALMQEHFNSDYVESDKYPKSEFKGTILNNSSINYKKDGSYSAQVSGKLTLHNVTHNVNTKGLVKIENGKVEIISTFEITLADYNIKIPSVVKQKVSKTIKITVDCKLEELK